MFFLPMLIGAGVGAIANKKNPLQGALMGAGIGATGGAAAGLLGGGAAAGGSAAGLMGPAMQTGASSALPGLESYLAASPSAGGGLLGTLKPIGQYANMAQQAGMFGGDGEQPMSAPPMQQNGSGAQTLAQLAQNDSTSQTAEEASMRRRRRKELLEGMV